MKKTKEELEKIKQEKDSLLAKIEELSEDEMKQISGGRYHESKYYKTESEVQYIHDIGDIVEVYSGWLFGTVRCRIIDRRIVWHETNHSNPPGGFAFNVRGYRDEYKVQEIKSHWYFYLNNDWMPRDYIEM